VTVIFLVPASSPRQEDLPDWNRRFAPNNPPRLEVGPSFPEGYAPQRNHRRLLSGATMQDTLSLGAGWHEHDWVEPKVRLVRVATGDSVVQRHCARCHRDFITTPSGERNAVFVSAVSFFLLDEEVTNRWVNLPCPGRRLLSDDDDRKRRIAELAVSHTSEPVMALQNSLKRTEAAGALRPSIAR
jgi:hypothetical protein